MARQVIIVDVETRADSSLAIMAVYWLTAPANHVKPNPNFVSRVPLAASAAWGATAAEVTALQAGTVVEQSEKVEGIPSATTVAAIQATAQANWNTRQTALTSAAPGNKYIGASWDGVVWTAAP